MDEEKEGIDTTWTSITSIPEITDEEPLTAPAKSRIWLLLVLILVFFILAAVGLVFATEIGPLNLGLEKYYARYGLEKIWGGLSVNPSHALQQSQQGAEKISSYAFEETADLSLSYKISPNAETVFGLSSDAIKQTSSAVQNSFSGQSIIGGEPAFQTTIKTSRLDTFFGNLGYGNDEKSSQTPKIVAEQIFADRFYFRVSTEGSVAKWQATDFSAEKEELKKQMMQYGVNVLDETQNIDQYLKNAGYIKKETINKTPSYHFQAKVKGAYFANLANDGNLFFAFALPSVDKNIAEADYDLDFWIDQKNQVLQKISFTIPDIVVGDPTFEIRITGKFNIILNSFNKISKIETPAADQVEVQKAADFEAYLASLNLPYYTSALGQLNGDSLKIFIYDSQRKKDLRSLQEALEKYKEDNSAYPLSPVVSKTNDKNSPLAKLVPKYLTKLPVDPSDSQYYYGYKSDGKTYQLTCILEDETDPAGVKVGSYLLYILPAEL